MASVIDPVTGLPMPAAPDILSDIPLGTQVFPWADVKAANLPPQGPSYPNDILNTAALLTALDPTQPDKPAQALYTDGNHNLRLSGGGGASSFVQPQFDSYYIDLLADSGFTLYYKIQPCPDLLYGFSVSAQVLPNPSPDWTDTLLLRAVNDDGSAQVDLATLRSTEKSPWPVNLHVMFPIPLALSASLGNPPFAQFSFTNPGDPWDVSLAIFISNGQVV